MQYKSYKENYAEGTYTFTVECFSCKKDHNVTVPGDGLYQYNQGAFIQVAFPELSADERELLISGTCGTCWEKMFAEDE